MLTLIQLIVLIVVIGLCVGLLSWLPIPEPFRRVVYALAVLIVIVLLLQWAGLVGPSVHARC